MLDALYQVVAGVLPFECMQDRFMKQALVGLLLLAPMAAALGVQVVNFRMAFFADAISHSAFAGVAIGLLLHISPDWTMPLFGMLVGMAVMHAQRRSALSADTIIGVAFSAVMAFGIAVISRDGSMRREIDRFVFGDILMITDREVLMLLLLAAAMAAFQALSYNRLLYIGLNPVLAKAHQVQVGRYQYVFVALLSLVVIFSVWIVGVLLVTALLVVPAAGARCVARSAGSMFWWAMLISASSAVSGLILSAQEWADTATGATVILVAFLWFVVCALLGAGRNRVA